jgi:hypothetical protein
MARGPRVEKSIDFLYGGFQVVHVRVVARLHADSDAVLARRFNLPAHFQEFIHGQRDPLINAILAGPVPEETEDVALHHQVLVTRLQTC